MSFLNVTNPKQAWSHHCDLRFEAFHGRRLAWRAWQGMLVHQGTDIEEFPATKPISSPKTKATDTTFPAATMPLNLHNGKNQGTAKFTKLFPGLYILCTVYLRYCA